MHGNTGGKPVRRKTGDRCEEPGRYRLVGGDKSGLIVGLPLVEFPMKYWRTFPPSTHVPGEGAVYERVNYPSGNNN
ncbi:MAG TPA: hypothetical protein VGE52_12285 [Pirellulales bacterium]